MKTTRHPISPPSLTDLAAILKPALEANYKSSTVTVSDCPDLTRPPFHLAAPGLSGDESVSDTGGPGNLFPSPRLECKFSLLDIAREMQMSPSRGLLIGAGAGPFHVIGQNSELAPNLSWEGSWENAKNLTRFARMVDGRADVDRCPSTDCALMVNLFGCQGLPGEVLRITARGRYGEQRSFTECIRQALQTKLGDEGDAGPVSLGGVFVVNKGTAKYHIMPDFPPAEELPFKSRDAMEQWLTYHDFQAPMVCLTVLHSSDPGRKLGLRVEHTHCFSPDGRDQGGHYHYDVRHDDDGGDEDEVEYEGYFNTAKAIYRIEKPE